MPVQIVSISPSPTLFLDCHDKGPSTRPFNMPRIRHVATTLLRHNFVTPSAQQITESKHHNSRTIACRLPEEVMRKIFIQCAQLGGGDCESWSWVNISYVCAAWRRFALNAQDLWRYIDFSDPRWHSITFKRAKMSSLHINAHVTDGNVRLLHRTLQLAHRIQDIHLTSPIQKIYPLLEVLAHPNPSLESLVVDIRIPKHCSFVDVYDPPLFPTSGPPLRSLRYMELNGAPFYLLTSRCTSLTQLHLHNLPFTERPTLRYFIFMIEQLVELQHLTLDKAFPINMDSNDIQALERRITLPHLRRITVVGSVSEIGNILDCIKLPPSVLLNCKICTLSDLTINMWKLAQILSIISSAGAEAFPLETLVLSGHESMPRFTDHHLISPEFRQSLRIRAFRADCGRGGAAFDLSIEPEEHNPNDDTMITALTAIWKALSLSQIHTLALQDLDIVTQISWSQFLRTIPSLRILDITGRSPSGLVWALLLNARSHAQALKGDGRAQRLLLPILDDIYLHRVDCSSGGFMVAPTAPVNSHSDLDDSRFLDVLTTSLGERRRFGLRLRSLSIARCEYVRHAAVQAARNAVSHLVCDLRNVNKEDPVEETWPARYCQGWKLNTALRHYHRLRTLVLLDSGSE
ncbi:hypothetical protein B0H34DRAFT_861379 [Crassisporium funariophilum]|nr:hypothetical protein B0H34DRAFT_861379 [Crassisporium funariophilum]